MTIVAKPGLNVLELSKFVVDYFFLTELTTSN